jgi:membrane protease YdiL (CAAX protease family)
MLVASILTGRYVPDWSTVSVSHTLFSLNPGIWEEFFYRGTIMIVLLKRTKSARLAALIQIVLFGLAHVKGFDLLSWVDVLSVMIIAVAFTYTAYKTRALIAGIVFHFLHDVFLFFVQVSGDQASGFAESAIFYASLWIGVGLACLVTRLAADKLGVQAPTELYQVEQDTELAE